MRNPGQQGALSKRISSKKSREFASLELESLGNAAVITAIDPGRDRQQQRNTARETAQPAPPRSFEQELLESIRQGAWSSAISTKNLEQVVLESSAAGREDGYREGYAEGLQVGQREGRRDGLQAARDEVDDQLQRLARVLNNLLAPIEAQQEQLQASLSQLVIRIAREVIRRELETGAALIRNIVREALAAMPAGATNTTIFLNPNDHELLQSASSDSVRREDWRLEPDDTLEPGDCRVESEQSLITWSTEDRLQLVLEELFSGDRQ